MIRQKSCDVYFSLNMQSQSWLTFERCLVEEKAIDSSACEMPILFSSCSGTCNPAFPFISLLSLWMLAGRSYP